MLDGEDDEEREWEEFFALTEPRHATTASGAPQVGYLITSRPARDSAELERMADYMLTYAHEITFEGEDDG